VGRLFWKTCAGTAPSLRYIGRLAFRPDQKWSLLAQAVEYERLARTELEGYFTVSRWDTAVHLVTLLGLHQDATTDTAGRVTETLLQATTGLPPKADIAIVAE
jgi:hypothetical protein